MIKIGFKYIFLNTSRCEIDLFAICYFVLNMCQIGPNNKKSGIDSWQKFEKYNDFTF
jgi:hypothetical protein